MNARFSPTRRQLLRGAGGFTLALPVLPSLLPRGAQARSGSIPPRLVTIATPHGGIWTDNMHPAEGTLTDAMNYAGHEIRRGDLAYEVQGDDARLSNVCRASAERLTPELAAKMNIIRGLDVPFYIGHHRGGHLGNWADNDGNGEDGVAQMGNQTPTIDQVLAWSDTFYGDLSTTLERSMQVGQAHSHNWSNPQSQSGEIQVLSTEYSSLGLFNRIFVPDEEETNPRPPVADRILANYQSLMQSDRRLSSRDRQRLDEHVQRIDELQRRLAVAVSCGDIPVPRTDAEMLQWDPTFHLQPELNAQYWQLFNDVVVAAFICGTSRIATFGIVDQFADYAGDWHQDVAHQGHLPDAAAQAQVVERHQRIFEDVFIDLITKLDIEDAGGGTILDNTLVQWTQESGLMTHESVDSTIVTAGGAAGCWRTGQYIDYRKTEALFEEEFYQGTPVRLYPGLLYQQYLGTVLQAMGLPPEEYELEPGGGYPELFIGEGREVHYNAAALEARGQFLPWLDPLA